MAIMTRNGSPTRIVLLSLFASLLGESFGLDISYCSDQNNAGAFQSVYNQFQSNGACQQTCQGSYAFAILQGSYCWCSNYIPENQLSTFDCNQECPGYETEWCGNTDEGLYGYYLLSPGVPRGTMGADSSSTLSPTSIPEEAPSTSSEIASSSSSSSTHSETTTATPSPSEVYTSIITVTGEASSIRTVLVTPTPATTQDATLGQSSTSGGGVNTGNIVGIVLGVAGGVGLIVGALVWCWFKKRQRKADGELGSETTYVARSGGSPSNNIPSRQVSQMSSSTLLKNKVPFISTNGVVQGGDLRSADTASAGRDRRSLGTDQRLNPYALYIHDESRGSNVSLQDNQDYSRQLRVANPDP